MRRGGGFAGTLAALALASGGARGAAGAVGGAAREPAPVPGRAGAVLDAGFAAADIVEDSETLVVTPGTATRS